MFVIFGDKHRTEPVPEGMRVTRECPKCKETAEFRERVVSKQFRLYFVEMFTHSTHHVLECSACGTTFVTDEIKDRSAVNDQEGTVFGHLQGAFTRGKEALEDGSVAKALDRAESEVGKALGAAGETVGSVLGGLFPRDGGGPKK